MAKIIGSPTRYIQGRGELANFAKHAGAIGDSMFILVDKFVKPLVMPSIEAGMGDRKFEVVEFGGECSMTEINRVIEELKAKGGDVVVGIGGGKTHDTAKAVGYYTGHPVVSVLNPAVLLQRTLFITVLPQLKQPTNSITAKKLLSAFLFSSFSKMLPRKKSKKLLPFAGKSVFPQLLPTLT